MIPGDVVLAAECGIVLSEKLEMRTGGDPPEDESKLKAFAAAFVFLPPFYVLLFALRLERQQS